MRRFTRLGIIAVLFPFSVISSPAQEAPKILDQYFHAAGGVKAFKQIQTLTLEGTVTNSSAGKTGTYTFITKLPNRFYSELNFGNSHLIEAYNGKSAWHEDASGDIGTLLGPEAIQVEAAAQVANTRLLNLKKNKLTVAFVGHAQVRDKDALQIEVTTASGVKRQLFFDPQTHLLVKEAAPVGGVDEEILYDDYRSESGIQLPHTFELHHGNDSYAVDLTRIVINGVAGERIFFNRNARGVISPELRIASRVAAVTLLGMPLRLLRRRGFVGTGGLRRPASTCSFIIF